MRRCVEQAARAGALGALLLVAAASEPLTLRRDVADAVAAAPPVAEAAPSTEGRAWLEATRAALDEAAEVRAPFVDTRELSAPTAAAFELEAFRGQVLEVTLTRNVGAPQDAHIYVEIFRVVEVLGQPLRERLAGLRPSEDTLRSRLPSDGTYHVLVQSDAHARGRYRLTLELEAALPFPVVGARPDAIRSLFGASRDGGRHHEGIDIFVQRLTPVLAVAPGSVTPSKDALGGNTVWLNTPGTSYYYAHLDRVAVKADQHVKAGDVLGYVGNTGNARNVPSHLHFGVYRWGRDPVDPWPLVVGQRFNEETPATSVAGAGG